jgi:hypothetical protein
MRKRLSIWRKLNLYYQYRKTILNKKDILQENGFRIDRVKRIYTVVNVPEQLFEGGYDLRTADINRVSKTYLTEAIRNISKTLNMLELNELYKIYDTQKVDKFSYLIIFGFSLFDTKKIADFFYFRVLPFLILSAITTLILIYK